MKNRGRNGREEAGGSRVYIELRTEAGLDGGAAVQVLSEHKRVRGLKVGKSNLKKSNLVLSQI